MHHSFTGPECATRSASTKPGGGSRQSEKVRTGIDRRIVDTDPGRRRRLLQRSRCGCRARSIVAALIFSSAERTSGAGAKCPWRTIASINVGMIAFSRLPQTRSDASHSTISASRSAAP
jgi:hypothetical protein